MAGAKTFIARALNVFSPTFTIYWYYVAYRGNNAAQAVPAQVDAAKSDALFLILTIPVNVFCLAWIFFFLSKRYPAPFSAIHEYRLKHPFKAGLYTILLSFILVVIVMTIQRLFG